MPGNVKEIIQYRAEFFRVEETLQEIVPYTVSFL